MSLSVKDPATTEIYTTCPTLPLHDALPVCCISKARCPPTWPGWSLPWTPKTVSIRGMEIPALPEGIEDSRLQRLAAYWDSCRAGRAMPARADIDPLDMGYLLGNLALVEVRPGGRSEEHTSELQSLMP